MSLSTLNALYDLGYMHGRWGIAIPASVYAMDDIAFGAYLEGYEKAHNRHCNEA